MNCESYNEVLDFLESYFMSRVKDPAYLSRLGKIIEDSRQAKIVPIRAIHQTFINYTEEYNDYSMKDEKMRNIWRDLLDIWQ